MTENDGTANVLKPVSSGTLTMFDEVCASVEQDVVRQCLSMDNPERTMGANAETMIKGGLGFVSKMLRATMAYGAEQIIQDQLVWAKTALPGRGVSMQMILNNYERYAGALEQIMIPSAYEELRPYLIGIIRRQRAIVEEAHGNDAR